MSDGLFCGRGFRTFNVVDDFNRETQAIEIDLSLPSQRVIRILERLVSWRGQPQKLRMDNGPEFISNALAQWTEEDGVELEFIKPGKPTQNSYVERFNRTYRDEVLNMYVFKTMNEVREITRNWIREYNEERPHDSLSDLTPWEYLAKHPGLENSNLRCNKNREVYIQAENWWRLLNLYTSSATYFFPNFGKVFSIFNTR